METDGFVSNYFITTYFTTVIIIMSDIYDLIYVLVLLFRLQLQKIPQLP